MPTVPAVPRSPPKTGCLVLFSIVGAQFVRSHDLLGLCRHSSLQAPSKGPYMAAKMIGWRSWPCPFTERGAKPGRSHTALLTAAPLGALTQAALRSELAWLREGGAGKINPFASLSDFDHLHLDFFEALGTWSSYFHSCRAQ